MSVLSDTLIGSEELILTHSGFNPQTEVTLWHISVNQAVRFFSTVKNFDVGNNLIKVFHDEMVLFASRSLTEQTRSPFVALNCF